MRAEKFGSYSRIHEIRRWALEHIEGNPAERVEQAYKHFSPESEVAWSQMVIDKCPALINHSDCDGGYLSFEYFGIKDVENRVDWGNLDKLREELQQLKARKAEMPKETRESFEFLCEFVFPEDEDYDFQIVNFG